MTKKNRALLISLAVVFVIGAVLGSMYWKQQYVRKLCAPLGGGRFCTVKPGFGGDVYVELGLNKKGEILDIVIGDEGFSETPGLGARAKEPAFYEQFIGKSGSVAFGTDFDAIGGATITSTAVREAVNGILANADLSDAPDTEVVYPVHEEPAELCANLGGGRFSATEQGFGGTVYVELGLNKKGEILDIVIGDENFSETPGLGARTQEPAFYEQFIGKSGSVTLGTDIDAVGGATITSTAVTNAVNTILANADLSDAPDTEAVAPAVEEPAQEETAAVPAEEAPAAAAVEVTGTAQGFGGEVAIKMSVDGNTITAFEVTSAANETPGLGARSLEPEFAAQFVGKTLPIALSDIDAITSATITSTAVVNAANAAFETVAAAPAAEEAPAAAAVEVTGSAQGFGGEVAIRMSVDGNTITAFEVTSAANETPALGGRALEPEFAAQFVGKTLPIAFSDIDAITSATITSTAVVNAINEAYKTIG